MMLMHKIRLLLASGPEANLSWPAKNTLSDHSLASLRFGPSVHVLHP